MITEKNLLLDLGDTLVHISEPFEVYTKRAIWFVLNEFNSSEEVNIDQFLAFRNRFRKEAHRTLIERNITEFLSDSFKEILDIDLDQSQLESLELKYITSEIGITHLFEDALPFLERANEAGRKIYIATNNFSSAHVFALLDKFKMNNLIHGVHISGDQRIRKPDAEFLNSLAKRFILERNDSIMIGDKYEMDVLAGLNSGISTCLLNRKEMVFDFEQGRPDHMYNSLNEIEFS